MHISFICRASKARKDGQSPIELSIIINSERAVIALDRKCKSEQFNCKTQKVRGDKSINDYLDAIKKKCYSIETEIIKKENDITLSRFLDVFKNGFQDNRMTLIKLFKQHNTEYKKKVLAGIVIPKTLERYGNTLTRLQDYLHTLGKTDILLTDVTSSFIEGFQTYCLSSLKIGTTNKNLKHLKKILVYAIDEGYIKSNPFRIKLHSEKLDYQPLTKEEIHILSSKEISNARISNVRDCFIFQCYTGLSYCDMASLTKDDIINDMILKRRKKTDVQSVVPLLPEAKRILEKYNYNLPIISNQRYNSYLQEIADICNINKKLHSHLARHTMATILINSNVNIEIIAKILGHSSSAITRKVYAQMLNTTVQDNANIIAEAFSI